MNRQHRGIASGRFNRRTFLAGSALTGAAAVLGRPKPVRARSPNEKLHIGIIGVANRGETNMHSVEEGNQIVALCDVNAEHLAMASEDRHRARQYRDYRRMLEAKRDLDAVVISTPDHTHALPTLMALDLDLHVYCEKALTHSVAEARRVRRAAEAKPKLATQMGIQIQAGDNFRRVVELIRSGAIGKVSEVHVWVTRAKGGGDKPAEGKPVPDHIDWDLWLGPAPERPWHPIYHAQPDRWYKFWEFGGGTTTDLGSHWIDLPFRALRLDAPHTIEADGPAPHPETAPTDLTIRYDFAARDDRPAVKLYWSLGIDYPPRYKGPAIPDWSNGALFVGESGMILSDYRRHVLLPEEKFADFEGPEPFLERSPGHHAEWLRACKGGPATHANFSYAGPLTELNALGVIAYRSRETITWDADAMRITDSPAAQELIHRTYRPGWELPG